MAYKRAVATNPPSISLRQMRDASFNFDGQTYPLVSSPTPIFKQAVRASHPTLASDGAIGQLLEQESLDMMDRWFVVLELHKLRHPMEIV